MSTVAHRQAKRLGAKAKYALEVCLPRYSRECARLRREVDRVVYDRDPLPEFEALKGTWALQELATACGYDRDQYEFLGTEYGDWLVAKGHYHSVAENTEPSAWGRAQGVAA